MRTCLAFLAISIASVAQSSPQFGERHARQVDQNPPGIRLTIATADGRSQYHLSDELRFKLFFTSSKRRLYTVEVSNEVNAAGISDDLVIQAPDMPMPLDSKDSFSDPVVCCGSDRHYIGATPTVATSMRFVVKWFKRSSVNLMLPGVSTPSSQLPPGDYAVFLETRRVTRGWPKSERETHHGVSNFTVTSSKILHITLLADSPSIHR